MQLLIKLIIDVFLHYAEAGLEVVPVTEVVIGALEKRHTFMDGRTLIVY